MAKMRTVRKGSSFIHHKVGIDLVRTTKDMSTLVEPTWPMAARCIIALNNIGCELMERNWIDKAHATFHDALRVLMQLAAAGENSTDLGSESPSSAGGSPRERFMNESLRQADLRLVSSPASSSFDRAGGACQPIRYNASAPSLAAALSQVRRNCCHSLRIDVASAKDERRIPEDVLTAIVLINYANAGLSKALHESKLTAGAHQAEAGEVPQFIPAETVSPMDRALAIIFLAHSIVEKRDARSESTIFLELLVLDTWIQVLMKAGRPTEADEMRPRLNAVCHYVESTFWFLYLHTPAACAA